MLAAVSLLGCNQLDELGNDPATCATSEDCGAGLVCLDSVCVSPAKEDLPNPELEREADELGKLSVERDMLESKVQGTSEALADAVDELADAKTRAEKKAAAQKKSKAAAEHQRAKAALDRFLKR